MKKIRREYTRARKRAAVVNDKIDAKKDTSFIRKFVPSGTIRQHDLAADLSQSDLEQKNTAGYIEFDGGFSIQWGRVFLEGGNPVEEQTFTFKKRFATRCFGVILNRQKGDISSANAIDITKSGFDVDYSSISGGLTDHFINFIAIGY